MKIFILNESLSRGGAERISVYLAGFLASKENESFLFTFSKSDSEYDVPKGVTRINADISKKKIIERNLFLLKKIKEYKPDVVLVMGMTFCMYLAIPMLLTKTKFILSERNDPVHTKIRKITKIAASFCIKLSDGFVFQTEQAKSYYIRKTKNRGAVIPNPIFVESLPSVYEGERKKEIVAVGRLTSQKNYPFMIKAFSKIHKLHPEYVLKIYGEGSDRVVLEELIKKLNLQGYVFLMGNVKNVLEYTKTASLFVMTSDYEGIPNALLESMAMGLPVISSACPCGGPELLIQHEENGMLFKLQDEDAFVSCVDKIFKDKVFSDNIATKATLVRELYNTDVIGDMWVKYLQDVKNGR